MKLILLETNPEGLSHVKADGSITATDFVARGKDPMEMLLGTEWLRSRLLLDFAAVTYIDSSAIGWLIELARRMRQSGGAMVIHTVQPNVRQILDVLKISRVVPMAEDESVARRMLGEAG